MKAKTKIDMAILKGKALTLWHNGQLPYKLMWYIEKLDKNCTTAYVKYLSALAEEFLRVKGYYHRHKGIEKQYNALIEQGIKAEFITPEIQ